MASGLVGPPLGMVKPELVPAGLPLPPHALAGPPAGLPPHADPAARLEAYKKVMRCFMQGSYDLAKEEALASLRSVLAISEQQHLSVRAAAMADAHHHLQLHPAAGSGEVSVGHSSQPLGAAGLPGSGGNTPLDAPLAGAPPGSRAAGSSGGAAAKRSAPSTASKAAAAAPRKRTRTAPQGATAGAGGARGGPAVRAPRAAAADVDPLVGRVVLRNWPHDGGFFRGVVSDYRSDTREHCIIYDMGKPSESYEWYSILSASPQDCQVTEERVDFATLSLPAGSRGAAAVAAAAPAPPAAQPPKPARPGSSVPMSASGVPLRGAAAASAAAKQQRAAAAASRDQGRQGGSKAGASRAAGGAKPAAKPAAPRSASAAAVAATAAAKPPAAGTSLQQQAGSAAAASAPAPAQQQQQPARNGKTHHAHLANGLSSHAAAVKQVLAAGGRPPYLSGHTLLPRRTRSWSSDEDSDDSDDE